MNKTLSNKSAVSAAVSATVAAAPAIDPTAIKTWEEMGRQAAIRDTEDASALAVARVLLKDGPYALWIAFGKAFMDGAKVTHRNPENLLHRVIYAPLAAEGIKRPVSPTSSAARPEAKVKADAAKAKADALAKVTDAALAADLKAGTGDKAALLAEMARRAKAEAAAASKVEREARAKCRKAVVEIVDQLTIPEMGKAHALLSSLLAKRSKK
jgi:hypothetical protein